MEYIKGIPREQAVLFTDCLDNIIASDNEVRLIDMFVESIEMEKFGFASKLNAEGRQHTTRKDLLKLFIYGYLNCIRSSRVLEKSAGQYRGDVAVATISTRPQYHSQFPER
ncbi:MAG: hypothetical protein IPH02_00705 [Sphingobacteriales bacterium]|nr:hypothetical protein [Sphingobacteriales bacterium]